MRRSPAEADAALAPGKFACALAQPMRRDLDIPHWTVPVPAETESDRNTQSRQVTQSHNRPHQVWHVRNNISDAFAECLSVPTAAQEDYRANVALT